MLFPGEYECRRHFGGSKPPKIEAAASVPKAEDPNIQAARARARLANRNRRGRAATILGGETQQDVVNQQQKELLGG